MPVTSSVANGTLLGFHVARHHADIEPDST
jgi:hypothetical protein